MLRRSTIALFLTGGLVATAQADGGFLPTSPAGSEPQTRNEFYVDRQQGWFFYELPPVTPEPLPDPEPESVTGVSAPTSPAPAEPAPLSVAWIRTNLPKIRDQAIDSPTPENISAYFTVQRVALDKANRFTEMAQRTVMGDPMVDESIRFPISNFARRQANTDMLERRRQLMKELADIAGVWFFYSADCTVCDRMIPILKNLERINGFKVMAISVDGSPPPDGTFAEWRTDQGQAKSLGIVSTPAVVLARPPDGIAIVAQSGVAADELEERILLTTARAGWIDEKTFLRGRAATATVPRLDTVHFGPDALQSAEQDPSTLVDYIRRSLMDR